jgi:SNF2 family DNA or RNA helicase
MSNEKLVPFDYQEHDIQQIIKAGGTGLVVSSVGGRKTLTAVEVGLRVKAKAVLVVAPRNTINSKTRGWQGTISRQDPTQRIQRLDSTKKGRAAFAELQWGEAEGWYLCTAQWFARQDWNHISVDMMVFDEIHTALNYSNRSRYKLHQMIDTPIKLALSGTPLRNKWENVWSLIRWLWPELMPDTFWAWRRKQAGVWDRFAQQNWKVTGERVPGTLVNSLPCYIQHLARERCCDFHPEGFLADLEEPLVVIREVELSAKQKRFYKQMEESYVAWLLTPETDTGHLPVVAELPITARGMLRTATLGLPSLDLENNKLYFTDDCESPKIDDPTDGLLSVLEEIDKQPTLVYLHDKRFTKVVVKRLQAAGYRAAEWSGDVTQNKRDQTLDQFVARELDVVVAVISAIGTGTDGIQDATNVEIWLSEDDDPTNNQQGRGRLDRPGQKNQVLRIYIRAKDSMDEGIMSKQLQQALQMNAQLRKQAA